LPAIDSLLTVFPIHLNRRITQPHCTETFYGFATLDALLRSHDHVHLPLLTKGGKRGMSAVYRQTAIFQDRLVQANRENFPLASDPIFTSSLSLRHSLSNEIKIDFFEPSVNSRTITLS
jgi:hypothetical protein